jgi:hypothetical protein
MAAKTTAWANALLLLLFNNTNAANIGDATGLRGSSTAGSLYVSLHTASPGASGDQTTSEAAYGSYARQAVARSGAGWTVSGNQVVPAAAITFPAATSGTETETHMGIGTDSTGTGHLLYFGTVTPNISINTGVTPQLKTTTALTET